MVSPPPNLRRSPRGNVKGGSATSSIPLTSSSSSSGNASVLSASTSGNSSGISWAHQSNSSGSNVHRSSSTRAGAFFSASALDSALSLAQQQPSTSQGGTSGLGAILSAGSSSGGGIATNPTIKLNKSILTSSALSAAAAAAAAASDNVVNVVGLVHGSSSSTSSGAGTSSSAPLQGFSGQSPAGGPPTVDPDADDPDVGRLQALLEARGIPPHVFGSLGEYSLSF